MTLSIRNQEADALARRLAQIDQTTITEAVVTALKEAIQQRVQRESPTETARRLLAKRGLSFGPNRKAVADQDWHDLDHDLTAGS
ncbi:MAG TPA: type II toxin-antitoxin system VapB family antitoxin [Sphingobium sp.]|uniref:type II toxin-antitoxin system VapB family antitoxin n=1 Tax=Sphingobium sp. TaxID=1912891 RepID=UPI002ED556F4